MNNTKDKEFWNDFLDLYKSMPCLWKVKSEDYSNRVLKNASYIKMVEKLKEIDADANREKVVKKINTFRSNYKRELKKVKKSEKSGAGLEDIFESSLWYFEKLKFLEGQELSQEGRCTMEDSDQSEFIPQPKKKKFSEENNLLKLACQKLNKEENVNSALAKGWAAQYAELAPEQKLFARSIIADTLFHGGLNKLNEKTTEDVHKVYKGTSVQTQNRYFSRSSTPYIDDASYSSLYTRSPPPQHEYLPSRPVIITNEAFPNEQEQQHSQIVQYFTQFTNELK